MNLTRVSLSLVIGLALLFAGPFTASAVVHPPNVNPATSIPPRQSTTNTSRSPWERCSSTKAPKRGFPPTIEGVQTTVVHHRSFEGSPLVLVEDTKDWFAQDVFGNVWYFGEDTIELPGGSTEGSWEAGVEDADAGFIMLADPQVGDRYYQEFARNVAEDQAKVLSRVESVTVQGVTYNDVLLTQERRAGSIPAWWSTSTTLRTSDSSWA